MVDDSPRFKQQKLRLEVLDMHRQSNPICSKKAYILYSKAKRGKRKETLKFQYNALASFSTCFSFLFLLFFSFSV